MKRCISYILSFLFVFLILECQQSIAQLKVQVVTQKINKSIDWEPGMVLQLSAERADIFFTTHSANTIDLEVLFISKNENISIAEEDLKKMKFLNETINKKVFIRNFIELSKTDSKPESDIKAIYHIKVPENCSVDINNYFGNIDVENLRLSLNIIGEFSKIDLRNISGKTKVKTTFGDVSAQGINGSIFVVSNRSNITLSNVKGTIELQSILAEIILDGINDVSIVSIDAEKSKVTVKTTNFNKFIFNLDLFKVDFQKPDEMNLIFTKNENDIIKTSFNSSVNHSQINVKLNVGTLNIEE
ncbi:MAG TPA: hypothetical protein VIN10_06630 [Bacteroidales bacterium]